MHQAQYALQNVMCDVSALNVRFAFPTTRRIWYGDAVYVSGVKVVQLYTYTLYLNKQKMLLYIIRIHTPPPMYIPYIYNG